MHEPFVKQKGMDKRTENNKIKKKQMASHIKRVLPL